MELLKTILNSSVLVNLLWLVFVLLVLLFFKKQIAGLLARLQVAEWGGRKLKFDEPKISPAQEPQRVTREGSIYWLGHDIRWTMDIVMIGFGNQEILHGLKQSVFHAKICRLDSAAETLERLRQNVQTQPKALSDEDRTALIQNLGALRGEIGQQLTAK